VICGLLKWSDEAALYRESARDIGPTVAAKVLVHLIASKISALIGLIAKVSDSVAKQAASRICSITAG
jgi:hypothetical protein